MSRSAAVTSRNTLNTSLSKAPDTVPEVVVNDISTGEEVPETMNAVVIETHGVAKIVPTTEGELAILEGIDLEINAGESVAIVGASGSGKTVGWPAASVSMALVR